MNKQIAILAIACLVVGLVVAANILPRVLAQELEKKIQSMPSITNATQNQKVVTIYFKCNKPNLSQGEKLEAAGCTSVTNDTTFLIMGSCVASSLKSGGDYENSCNFKPIR
jgi:hypothetical protein